MNKEEVQKSMFSIYPNKSPGPDGFNGFNSYIFQKTWHIIGEELVMQTLNFFFQKYYPKTNQSCYIALVPKIQNPDLVKDFRPIACCNNTLYKCILKILVNKMKPLLSKVVDNS